MDMTSVFAEITKTAPQEDGSLLVYGKATGSDLDLDQQRCDPDWLKRAMPEWFTVGNIREQHDSKKAAGKAVEHEVKDDGHWIKASIIDPIAVAKTKAGVYTGFSIGIAQPRIDKSESAPGGVIADGKIIEVSLVDRPCLPTAVLTVCKSAEVGMELNAADFDAERNLVRCEELVEKADEVEKATDVDHLEAPAPGQLCEDCGEDGHLKCAELPEVEKGVDPALQGCGCCSECEMANKAAGFDREKAAELVKDTLLKADSGVLPPEYAPEQMDIENAQAAISLISKLIQSEAAEMVDNPAEDCDIQLLLSAVSALRCFIGREQEQAMGADVVDSPVISLAADAELEKADSEPYGDVAYADPGYQKDGKKRYPIDTEEHVRAALSYINQSRNASEYSADQLSKIKGRIMAAAKKFGIDVDKSVEPEEVKTVEQTEEVAEVVEKTIEPEAVKAATVEEESDGDALVKALEAALSKADSPLRKTFASIVEASTEATAESVKSLTERLAKVEQMAVPGGPVLRRTEIERAASRRGDLESEAAHYKALAQAAEDPTLRRGYATKAAQLEAQVKAL